MEYSICIVYMIWSYKNKRRRLVDAMSCHTPKMYTIALQEVLKAPRARRYYSISIGISGLSSRSAGALASSSAHMEVKTFPIDLPRAEASGTGTAFPIWRICCKEYQCPKGLYKRTYVHRETRCSPSTRTFGDRESLEHEQIHEWLIHAFAIGICQLVRPLKQGGIHTVGCKSRPPLALGFAEVSAV